MKTSIILLIAGWVTFLVEIYFDVDPAYVSVSAHAFIGAIILTEIERRPKI